jgi:CubicO group peptidase (beta-lactamase class C family)
MAWSLILLATIARGQSGSNLATEKIDAFVEAQMHKRHIPGVSVAIVRDGKTLLAKGYGLANVELQSPATEETVYQLASVTKPFTATAVMRLVEEGKLGLDDSISSHLNDLPEAWRNVTVRHLLSHTSGIKSYTSVPGFGLSVRRDYAKREILDLVAQDPLEFEPGERWNYSNTGYFLLGMLIEKVSGQKYPEFMSEQFFQPLGMSRTRVNDLRALIMDRSQGYAWNGKELRNGEYTSPTQPFSAGALVSSVGDMIKWDAALEAGKVIQKSTIDQMWTPAEIAEGGKADYGLGWQVGDVNGHRLIRHGGGIPGFSTEYCRYPDDRLMIVVLTNLEGGNAEAIAEGIAGLISDDLVKKPEEPIADDDPEQTDRLRGALVGALKEELDPELFAEETLKALEPRVKADKQRNAALGELKSFELLERKEIGRGLQLRYRAGFEKQRLTVFYALESDGKIRGLGLRPEA